MTTMVPVLEHVDHIHVHVSDRNSAETWYADVLGLRRDPKLEQWSHATGGPLMLKNPTGTIMLAIFEHPRQICRSTIAFNVHAAQFLAWKSHLTVVLDGQIKLADHHLSWSIYFTDPYDNPYEITCYEYATLAGTMQ
ncbi:VOC family protein [Acidiphilium sp.]|uniref:VOC family protein n=1 Tax=Acidiphilium sp. TaxID=527 RepID=UPI003CFC230C